LVSRFVANLRADTACGCVGRVVDELAMNGVATAISVLANDPELY